MPPRWLFGLWLAALGCGAILIPLRLGPLFVDDAYISFRYAENIAVGQGFVYNPGEKILGTTSPLYTLLLAVLRQIGIAIPAAGYGLGIVFSCLSAVLVFLVFRRLGRAELGMASSLLLCVLSPWTLAAVSGMETTLYASLLLGAFLFYLEGKNYGAAIVAGLATLVRPDGIALAAVLLAFILPRGRRPALAFLLGYALVVLPWFVFAAFYFGSVIPHTIVVKKLILPQPWWFVLAEFGRQFIGDPGRVIVSAFFAAGLAAAIMTRRELRPGAAWILVYIAGYAAAQVLTVGFPWYFAALVPFYVLIAAAGVELLLSRWPGRGKWLVPLPLVVVAALYLGPAVRARQQEMLRRESAYRKIALWILRDSSAGDEVYAGEIGALGYFLKNRRIIDSSGLISQDVYDLRKIDKDEIVRRDPALRWAREGTPWWSWETIVRHEPRYITSRTVWLHLPALSRTGEFQARYEDVTPPDLRVGGNVIYRAKKIAGGGTP
jgi:hypothetical protein